MAVEDAPLKTGSVPVLAKISLRYDQEEDRIRLDGADSNGETLTLWLTARLLNRLVPYLIDEQLGVCFSEPSSLAFTPESIDTTAERDTAVHCLPGSPEILVAAIDLKISENQKVLIFKDGRAMRRALFCLSANALQLWTDGLSRCYAQAQWSQEVFRYSGDSELGATAAITIH